MNNNSVPIGVFEKLYFAAVDLKLFIDQQPVGSPVMCPENRKIACKNSDSYRVSAGVISEADAIIRGCQE